MRLPNNKRSNNCHILTPTYCPSLRLTNNKRNNNSHILTPIYFPSLLVRRKILRLYFLQAEIQKEYIHHAITMASACRDAKSCVSRTTNATMTAISSPQVIAHHCASRATNATMTAKLSPQIISHPCVSRTTNAATTVTSSPLFIDHPCL